MPDFHNNGASIHYELMGSGPPLLLIAGLASDGASWGPLVPKLPERRLIMIDNRGSGRTRADGPLTLDDMVGDCIALLELLRIEHVDIVGHSLGGFLALLLATREPARVRRLVTLASAGLTASKRILLQDLARLGFTTPPEDWFRLLYQWLFSDPFFADEANVAAAAAASAAYPYRQSPSDFARQVAALDRFEPTDFGTVACPVLALAARLDLLAPVSGVTAMHAAIPEVIHRTIEGAAHSVHWEQPEAVAEAIRSFLAGRS